MYTEIQMVSFANSYVMKGFLIYEEMRKYLVIYEDAVSHIWLCNCSRLNFLIYEENFLLFFYQCADLWSCLSLEEDILFLSLPRRGGRGCLGGTSSSLSK
jgi:hypothetical protein